jgi:hypothetical protein
VAKACPNRPAAEAAAVRTIFARYLELGSVRTLAQDLDRRGIRSKPRRLRAVSGHATLGEGMELESIAATVIGGTAL